MIKGNRFQVSVFSFILFLILSTVACTLYPTYAAESSPSADIKIKLDELKKEIASKAAQLKQSVDRKLKDKAYAGKVKSKSDTSITLATDSGPKIVSINQDTDYQSNLKSKVSLKTLDLEDYIAALGDTDETRVLIAKKIILLAPPSPQKVPLWGQIIAVSEKLVTLKTNDLKNMAAVLPSSKAKLNDFVILTGTQNNNEIFEAEFIYVIPQGAILKPKKLATPSASLKPVFPKPISR